MTPPAGIVNPKTPDVLGPNGNQAKHPRGGVHSRKMGRAVDRLVSESSRIGTTVPEAVFQRTETVDAAAVVPGAAQIRMRCKWTDTAKGAIVVFATLQIPPATEMRSLTVIEELNAVLLMNR